MTFRMYADIGATVVIIFWIIALVIFVFVFATFAYQFINDQDFNLGDDKKLSLEEVGRILGAWSIFGILAPIIIGMFWPAAVMASVCLVLYFIRYLIRMVKIAKKEMEK